MGTALITGASSGIGAELAKLFAADRHDLVLVARRRDRLEELASALARDFQVKCEVVAADLAAPSAVASVVEAVKRAGVEVEFLVNSAGFGSSGPYAELDGAREVEMVQVNVIALMALTRAFLPGMLERGRGRILNLGSTAGFQPGPFMATYYASKAFVNSFTEALWFELRGSGVTATVTCPGAVATEFSKIAGNDASRLFRRRAAAPDTIAREAYRAMMAGRPMIVHGLRNALLIQSERLSPRSIVRSVAASLNRPPGGASGPAAR